MNRARQLAGPALVVALGLSLCTALAAAPAGATTPGGLLPFGCANPSGHRATGVLPAAEGSVASAITCFGSVVVGAGSVRPDATGGPVGYGPSQIRSAYNLFGKSGKGRLVAVVDAYDDPKAESDLAVYRQAQKLPPCTTANGCFQKLDQSGRRTRVPARDYGWAEEISLDLDAVSATCPDCHILLVEANSAEVGPLMAAVDTAVRHGAVAVANSWGGREDGSILSADTHLNHPGVAITAASGDDGYGVQWPASSRYVTGVGGTTLKSTTSGRGWTETAWSGAGSGCSRYEPKPSWQHDGSCKKRTVADVAAVANPSTGLGVYDTFNNCTSASLCDTMISRQAAKGLNGWAKIGGTSLSAPVVAAIYAIAGNHKGASWAYSHRAFYDVASGANGHCSGSYLCTAKAGYDGPTGLGSPHGLNGF